MLAYNGQCETSSVFDSIHRRIDTIYRTRARGHANIIGGAPATDKLRAVSSRTL